MQGMLKHYVFERKQILSEIKKIKNLVYRIGYSAKLEWGNLDCNRYHKVKFLSLGKHDTLHETYPAMIFRISFTMIGLILLP